jgi:hypothetical protein
LGCPRKSGSDQSLPPSQNLSTSHGSYTSLKSDFLPSRLTSPGLIPGPTNSFPLTSATASASSPSLTGTLLRTNSIAVSLSASYARKFRTIRGGQWARVLVSCRAPAPGWISSGSPTCGLVSPQLQSLQLRRFLCNSVGNVLALKLSECCAEEPMVGLKVASVTQCLRRLEVHFFLPRSAPSPGCK